MADLVLPEALREVELVRSVRTPARLEFTYTAGAATTRFLKGITEGKILGERAPGGKVYVPSRGADPQLGVPTVEQVELPHVGTLTSFCVVNVAFYGLIQECPVEDVHIGMRVEAVWVDEADLGPTLESIRYFRPNGEPDVPVTQPGKGVTW
jgi:uncharacterized protein